MRALLDGDIICYRAGFSAQHTHYRIFLKDEEEFGWVASFPYKKLAVEWVNGQEDMVIVPHIEYEPLENALQSTKATINGILRATGADEHAIFLTGKGNYREDVATIRPYKGNRDPNNKPKWYQEIRDYLCSVWGAEVIDGREADDALGCAQSQALPLTTVICTIDKDLLQIAGLHYRF